MEKFAVCVADDCADENDLLCMGLRLNNYRALAAYTGRETLDLCRSGQVDVLLLDVEMPDMDGYEVCRQLKADPATAGLPVIFITAHSDAENVIQGYDLGAADFIAKPFNLPIVMIRIEAIMRTMQSRDELPVADDVIDTAYTDQLTGLRNSRFLLERLQEEVEKAHRYDYTVSCVMLDVDDTSALDVEVGTAALDDILVEVAMAMRGSSRNYDILARYDGALFAAVLPHTLMEEAVQYAQKINEEITTMTFNDPCCPTQAKLRFGIVSCRNGAAKGADHILGEAMQGLLKAKSYTDKRLYAKDLNTQTESSF
ncbi:MAG: diguanylate cyclase [Candidatus Hydrogenedentes bacterium]|nr:diguanylate cyclase [Candidatus Hydrogenedentota bacterium]